MAKVLKILGLIVLTIILLLGIAIFLLVHYIDPNKLKDEISNSVYTHTGRHLSIGGELNWSFFPWLGFKAEKIELSNANGFGNKPFAQADEIDINIKVMPLLSGTIKVGTIEVDNLQVNLIQKADGSNNWSNSSARKATPTTVAAPPASSTAAKTTAPTDDSNAGLNFSIANLTIVNSRINFDNQKNNQEYSLSNFYVDGNNVGTQKLFPLTISFKLQGTKLKTPINVSFNGNFNIDPQLKSVAINQIEAKINTLSLQGDLSAKNLNAKANYQGDLHISPIDLKAFLHNFNIDIPTLQKSDALENVSTDLAFNGNPDEVSIKPLKIGLDSTVFKGNLTVKNFNAPQTNFKLSANQINIDDYMPAKQSSPTKTTPKNTSTAPVPPTKPSPAVSNDTPINLPIEMLRSLNADGSLSLDQLEVANLNLSNVNLTLNAKQGLIKLTPISAKLYEGNLDANASLNVAGNIPRYQLSLDIQKLQAEPFIKDLMNKDFITGTAKLSANLNTNGTTINTLISRLDGSSQFALNNGTLKGINIEYQLNRAKALLNKQTAPVQPKDKLTPFGSVTGTVQLNNGIATNKDLVMTNKAFTGNGAGTVNLNQQKIDYKIDLVTTKVDELKGYRVPITFTGQLSSPSIGLDTNDILQQVLNMQKQRLTKQAQQKAKVAIQKQVNQYLKNKDINKALGNLIG